MKKIIAAVVLLGVSFSASAVSPGGPGCGWGNLLFQGKNGIGFHLLASSVNGTSGNKTFGITSGTNGCSSRGRLTYGGRSLLSMNGVLEEVAQDMAVGHGEALNALSVSMGIKSRDRAHFDAVMHRHFATVFSNPNVTAGQVMAHINTVMKADPRLKAYTS